MKKAYLVGVNDYQPAGMGGPDLNGCVNDVRDMANTLVICGFEPKHMRICTDRGATRENIMRGLAALFANARPGDSLVFYYSGHGSQVADTGGDEVDQSDEILCPHDIDFGRRVFITDDDLRGSFAALPAGVNLEVILDCCHSGTATRDPRATGNGGRTVRSRYLAPPVDQSFHIEYEPRLRRHRLLQTGNSYKEALVTPDLNHTLWAACQDHQTSEETEFKGIVRGVFTYHFCKVLRRTSGAIERQKLEQLVTAALKREGFEQAPQLETSKEELLEPPFL